MTIRTPHLISRRRFLARFAAAGIGGAVFAVLGRPQIAQAQSKEQALLARVEAYLNGITTMRAKFLQTDGAGNVAHGTFYLRRPGRLRIEYAPPTPILIVGDGYRLIYYDKELESANAIPIDDTLGAFLARKEIRLNGDDVKASAHAEKGVVRVEITRRGEPEEGRLVLVFAEEPLALRQWVVYDPHGTETRVALIDPRFGVPLADSLFEIVTPEEQGG